MIKTSGAMGRLSVTQRGLVDKLPKPNVARVVGLHGGDPTFSTPQYIIDAACQAMRDGYTHYPAAQGDPQLRDAVAAYQSRISGVDVDPTEVLLTSGGTSAITVAMLTVLDPGEEVLILDPCYSLYADVIRLIGATPVFVPLTSSLKVDLDAVRAAVTPRTRMITVNYPSNPTGQLLEQHELDGLAQIAAEHNLTVLSDEVYDQLVFSGKHRSVLGHPLLTDRTILVNSFSKTYAMTGWRLGWVVAKGGLVRSIFAVNRSSVGWASNISQRAGLAALTNEQEDRQWRRWMLEQYMAQRKAMWDGLKAIPGIQIYDMQAAFYAWVRYDASLSAVDMVKYLYERGLSVRPGSEFGAMGERHLRLTFAPSVQVIGDGLAIFKAAMEELAASGYRPNG